MRFRERTNDEHNQEQQNTPSVTPAGENLDSLREDAERLLAAGDDAINRALSGNSEAFLVANRQQGGQ